ncbi:CU044_2847 family protein [Streptomyces sp. NPDC058632]|uniref:CU044_2847 family protein n=1 Tax=unclassified Streptomyces TaxID=2593676 RepID=UPI0036689A9C
MSTSPSPSPDVELDDGTPIRFLLAPAPVPGPVASAGGGDLPDGMGTAVPVAAGGRTVAGFAAGALRGTLKPLGPLLQEVHDAVTAVPDPPTEISVSFGVQVGQDLKFGIVGSTGQAHLTVTACWKPADAAAPATPAAPPAAE